MTRLTSITPGAKERISANAGRLYAALAHRDPNSVALDLEGTYDAVLNVAIAIENRVTELCRPTPTMPDPKLRETI